MTKSLSLFPFLSLLVVAACGGSTDDGPATSTADANVTACAALAKASCDKRETCRRGEATRLFGSVDACTARAKANCVDALSATGTGATAATTSTCAAAVPAAKCDDWFSQVPLAACAPAAGTKADGAACVHNGQCQSTFCRQTEGTLCGVCAPISKAGDSCATSGCGPTNLRCDATTMLCAAVAATNDACGKDLPSCGNGQTCVGSGKGMTGTCQKDVTTEGGACDPMKTAAPSCSKDYGLECDATTNTCKPVSYVEPGSPCGVVGTTVVGCTGQSTCVLVAGTKSGTCIALAQDGAACDTDKGPLCLGPARCATTAGTTAGTCQLAVAVSCP